MKAVIQMIYLVTKTAFLLRVNDCVSLNWM